MNWSLLSAELFGTIFLSGMVLVELFKPKQGGQGIDLSKLVMAGTLALFGCVLFCSSKHTGTGFDGFFIQDSFSVFFKGFFSLVFFVLAAMSAVYPGFQTAKRSEFFLILWCTLLGAFFLVSSNDLLLVFISLEIVTLSFYVMAAFLRNNSASIEAGLKYLILGSLASAFIIYGISLIYIATGATNFDAIKAALSAASGNKLLLLGVLFVISGLGFKIASAPFHLWAPDVYEGAPTPVVAALAVVSKTAGITVLLRVVFELFTIFDVQLQLLFSVLSVMTILYGNLGALVQTNIKRLFGYSSIGHAGYLLVGFAAGGTMGTSAIVFYLITYAFSNLAAFFVITLASRQLNSDQIEAYRGLGKRSPFLAAALFVSLLSLAGIPPLAGFFGKFYILLAAVKSGLLWVAVIGILVVVVSLYYYLSIIRTMYLEEPDDSALAPVPVSSQILLGLLLAGIFIAGFWQAPFFTAAEQAVKSLF